MVVPFILNIPKFSTPGGIFPAHGWEDEVFSVTCEIPKDLNVKIEGIQTNSTTPNLFKIISNLFYH